MIGLPQTVLGLAFLFVLPALAQRLALRAGWLWLIGGFALALWGTLLVLFPSSLKISQTIDRAYHDTYYVIAHGQYLLFAASLYVIPGVLLLLDAFFGRAHRRVPAIWLFWLFQMCWAVLLLSQHAFELGGMPRRYIDYPDSISHLQLVTETATVIAMAAASLATGFALISLVGRLLRGRAA